MLEIVRDLKDYPDPAAAASSLPELYAEVSYRGVFKLSEMEGEEWVYVFSERPAAELVAAGWIEKTD